MIAALLRSLVLTGVVSGGAVALAAPSPVAPTATPSPALRPTPGPTQGASSAPGPQATNAFLFTYRPTPSPATQTTPFPGPNAPQIAEIDLSDATLVTPGTIRVRVLTSDGVANVVAETFGNTFAIPKKEAGIFTFEGYVGTVPAYVKNRTYDVTFTASNADGRIATVTLPLTLR
ncbi:MAG: hypothetical protein NVS3B17_15710 [Vulcanimicrobiaceae bacterium]